ncbi:MAG: glycosyltransferase family 4 protein [Gracilimonas sp.]|uniref:glycosyltransferase family 4 protein n=1 Tax=Gracilimonas sp. TaxID=1974203 RepID=UPI001AFD5F70|nr:glycosyltransferase family 4 protein [Gracilimonas sp.]MBO6587224.1 glycosyltransferase family 4 protein [Gracilimonas sp.]MBO6614288.1 glycosyltransferase family 4 protein [Gracilimonas sp.]
MNILQIRGEFRDNGPGTQSLYISRELIRRGHKVFAISSGGVMVEKFEQNGITHTQIPYIAYGKRNPLNILKSIFLLRKYFDKHTIDVVHAHNAATLYMAYLASRFLKDKEISFFHSCRGIELRKMFTWRNWIYKKYPATIFAVSQWTKEQLINIGVDSKKIIVTNNGVDTDKYDITKKEQFKKEIRDEYKIPYDSIVIGIVGALGSKGHDELIRAFSMIKDEFPDAYLLIVGGGEKLEEFKNLAIEKGISKRCVFTGLRMDSYKLHAAMDIFCLASYWGEMFPNVLLEAMAYANPLISTKLSGIPEIVTEDVGFLIEPKNTRELAEKLKILLKNDNLRAKLGRNAYSKLKSKYTISKIVDKIETAYLTK